MGLILVQFLTLPVAEKTGNLTRTDSIVTNIIYNDETKKATGVRR